MFWSATAQTAANSSLFIEQIPIVDEASIKSEISTYCKLGAREESCTKRKSSGSPWLFVRFGHKRTKHGWPKSTVVRYYSIADIQEFGSHQKKNPGTLPGFHCLSGVAT
jgi:hypothetical protein